MSYNSKYSGQQVEDLLDQIGNKVDKEEGKGLSTEDFTTTLKEKLENLNNYDDTKLSESIMWSKSEGEAGVRLKGTNGTATGNSAISAGDDKKASDGTQFASVASGDHAVVFGFGNTCSGRSTLAQGLYNTVSGKDSVAFGQRNTVQGDQAFAAGQQNEVTARLGVAIGYKNKATNTDSVAIGYQNTSSGSASVAMGDTCEATGTSSVAMGCKTKATGAYSSTFGQNTQATNSGEVAMGVYNKSTTSTDASEQTMFSFGIGTSDTNRINAFEIKKNGDLYIGDKPISSVAISGSYNDLKDKPTIPTSGYKTDGVNINYGTITFGYDNFEAMKPNVIYVQNTNDMVAGVYIAEFQDTTDAYSEYSLIFKIMEYDDEGWVPGLIVPDYIKWANGDVPSLDYGTVYELSISRIKMPWGDEFNAILTPFKNA